MKTYLCGALALVIAANMTIVNVVHAGETPLVMASLSDVKLTQRVLHPSAREKQIHATLADTMRLLTWDEGKEMPLWDSGPLPVKPTKNVDQPGLGGE